MFGITSELVIISIPLTYGGDVHLGPKRDSSEKDHVYAHLLYCAQIICARYPTIFQ